MIFGDPSKFAVCFDIVDDWSTPTFKNGLLNIYVNFLLLGNRKNTSHDLGTNLAQMRNCVKRHEQSKALSATVLSKSNSDIYAYLYEYTFPKHSDERDGSLEYLAAPYSVCDEEDDLFLITDGKNERLFCGSKKNFTTAVSLPLGFYAGVVELASNSLTNFTEVKQGTPQK